MNRTIVTACVSLGLLTTLRADPPELIRVIRNANSIQPYVDAKAGATVIGASAVSGLSENWLVEMHDSFASIEALDHALAGASQAHNTSPSIPSTDDFLSPSRALIGLYRPGLSYRSPEAEKQLATAHYMFVAIYRVHQGSEAQFAETVRLRRARFDSINLDRAELCYEVISGATSGTYLFLAPLSSLKSLDDGIAKTPNYAEGVREAGKKAASDAEFTSERLLFRIEPRASYVSEEFASADPEFWSGKRRTP